MSALTSPLRRARWSQDERRRRHLRVVEAPVRRHTLAYALAVIVVLAAAVFGAVALNALAAEAAVQTRELEAHVTEAERAHAHLVAEVASLEDPARIREEALDLGLVPGGPRRHLALERNVPADGALRADERAEAASDPLKPLLSQER